jgi:HTH-like domain
MNSKRTYGAPRIKSALEDKGKIVSLRRTNRLMHEAGCETKYRKQFVSTTNSKHSSSIAENKLNREFQADKPNQKWVTDITYLDTSEGWLYLAVVMNLFSRMRPKPVRCCLRGQEDRGLGFCNHARNKTRVGRASNGSSASETRYGKGVAAPFRSRFAVCER